MEYQQLEQRSTSVKAAGEGYPRKLSLRIPLSLHAQLVIAAQANEKIIKLLT
jgi:predicted HicB family RNase H-like nuclease